MYRRTGETLGSRVAPRRIPESTFIRRQRGEGARDRALPRSRIIKRTIEVVCQSDAMTECDWRDLMLDIVEQHDIADGGCTGGREFPTGVERPFLTAVPGERSPALVRRGKDDHKCSKHPIFARSLEARLGERTLS